MNQANSDNERIKQLEESVRLLKQGGKDKLFKAQHKGKAILKEERPMEEKQSEIAATIAKLQDLLKVQDVPFIQQYAYKVAYITDQKAVKPEITIYSNDLITAVDTGVEALVRARKKLQEAGLPAAPLGEIIK